MACIPLARMILSFKSSPSDARLVNASAASNCANSSSPLVRSINGCTQSFATLRVKRFGFVVTPILAMAWAAFLLTACTVIGSCGADPFEASGSKILLCFTASSDFWSESLPTESKHFSTPSCTIRPLLTLFKVKARRISAIKFCRVSEEDSPPPFSSWATTRTPPALTNRCLYASVRTSRSALSCLSCCKSLSASSGLSLPSAIVCSLRTASFSSSSSTLSCIVA
mmetsp:Transcript_55289/g.135392  ORF Transcript_55289/g.135392 Transcript_55289/m.135392 type:complete len:226 (+) Transcript_55289:657-1334(+)